MSYDPEYQPDAVLDLTLDDLPETQEVDSHVQASYSSSLDEMADDDSLDTIGVEDLEIPQDEEEPSELVPDDDEFEDDNEDFDYEIDSDDD